MNPLVSTAWLASHLHDDALVILDTTLPPVGVTPTLDTRTRYLAKHIPGAVFFDIEKLSDRHTSLPHMLPSPEAFSHDMSELGVGKEMTIVVYEQEGVFSAPRAWWMLRTLGAHTVFILDGGLRSWMEAGLPTQAGRLQRGPAIFDATLQQDAVKDFSQIREMIQQHALILDARSSGRFAGSAPEPRPGISSGHMPGAISIPYTELVEDGRMKDAGKLQAVFSAKGVALNQPITTTCGSGVTAAVVALGLAIAGATSVSLYDGSWAEYAQHPEAVIEKSM